MFDLMDLNSSHIELYVVPSEERNEQTRFEWPQVNLTWKVQKVEANWIDLQMDFDFPIEISPLIELDNLVVNLRENSTHLFIATDGDKLKQSYYTLKSKIPKLEEGCDVGLADRFGRTLGVLSRIAFFLALLVMWVSNHSFMSVLMYVRTL
jgi:hypothetical protein